MGGRVSCQGRRHFLQQSFSRFDFILQQMFAGRQPEFELEWRPYILSISSVQKVGVNARRPSRVYYS